MSLHRSHRVRIRPEVCRQVLSIKIPPTHSPASLRQTRPRPGHAPQRGRLRAPGHSSAPSRAPGLCTALPAASSVLSDGQASWPPPCTPPLSPWLPRPPARPDAKARLGTSPSAPTGPFLLLVSVRHFCRLPSVSDPPSAAVRSQGLGPQRRPSTQG